VGENCKGLQKPLRIAEYLAARQMELDYDASCAYGDSASDMPMLDLTAQPHLVNPSRRVKKRFPHVPVLHWK